MNYDRKELLDALAARFVLGTMQGGARRRFERLMRDSRWARAFAARWSERLNVMAAPLSPLAPSDELWRRIERRMRQAGGTHRVSLWSWLGIGGSFALGAVIAALALRLAPTPFIDIERIAQHEQRLPQSYAGILSNADGKAVMLVSSTRHGRRAAIKVLAPISVPPGSVLRLYALPAGAPPFPLGNVPASGKGEVLLADTSEQLLSKVGELGVAIVPADAAASFVPERFVLRGPCAKFW